jgi:hypothetical protein
MVSCSWPRTSRDTSKQSRKSCSASKNFPAFFQKRAEIIHRREGFGILGTMDLTAIVHEPTHQGFGITQSAYMLVERCQVADSGQGRFMLCAKHAACFLDCPGQQWLRLCWPIKMGETVSQEGHGLQPPLAGFIGLLTVNLVGGAVMELALGVLSPVVIDLSKCKTDRGYRLGLI